MLNKFISFVRRLEIVVLRGVHAAAIFLGKIYTRIKILITPRFKVVSKTVLSAILVLYLIGAAVFGIRLYKQHRFEKIDLYASNIYPFPVANVGRSLVYNKQLQMWVYSSKKFAEKNNAANQIPADLAQKITAELVSYALTEQAADDLHVRLTQKEIDQKFDLTIEGYTPEQAADTINQLYGLKLNQFKRMISPIMLTEKIRDEKFVKIKASHILVKDEGKAKEVLQKLKDGAKFEDLAKEFSEDQSSKDAGGVLAGGEFLFRDSGLIPAFEDALFKLQKGQTSDLVKTDLGYHIIRCDDRQGEIDMKLADWTESLKKEYPVRIWIK